MAAHAPDDPSGDTAAARLLQDELAKRVELRDRMPKTLRTVAGFDVGFEDGGATARAAAVLLDAATMEVRHGEVVRRSVAMAYAPGLLSFRELPALLLALASLPEAPDLAFIAGHGVAHPRGLGLAAHFGVATGLASIGVAGRILVGSGPEPHRTRGAYTALRDSDRRQIGWLLRSDPDRPPLVVSPGHRVAMASAADLVMRYVTRDRVPEPIRLAARLAPPAAHGG